MAIDGTPPFKLPPGAQPILLNDFDILTITQFPVSGAGPYTVPSGRRLVITGAAVSFVELTASPPTDDRPHGVFATRSPQRPNPIGLTVVELLGREGCWCRRRHEDVRLETNQLGRQLGESIIVPFRAAILNDDVLAFHVTEIAQPHA